MKKIINSRLIGIGLLVLAAVLAINAFIEYRKTTQVSVTNSNLSKELTESVKSKPTITTTKTQPAVTTKPINQCQPVSPSVIRTINSNAIMGAQLDPNSGYGIKRASDYSSNYFIAAKYIAPADRTGRVDAFYADSLTSPSFILPASQAATLYFGSTSSFYKTAKDLIDDPVSYQEFHDAVECAITSPYKKPQQSNASKSASTSSMPKTTPTPPEKSKPISTITILDIPSFEVGETRSIIAIAKDASGNLVADGTEISISFDSSVLRFEDAGNIDTFQLYTRDGMVAINVIGLKIGASQVYATSGTKVASSLVRIISKAAISIADIASTTVGGTTTIVATARDDFGNLVPDGTQIRVSVSTKYLLLKTSTGTSGSTVTVGSSNGRVTVTGIGLLAGNSQVVATAGTTVGSALSVVTSGSSTSPTPTPAPAQATNTVSIQQPRISNSAVNYAYNRSDWGSGWSGSCPNTRAKVLVAESLSSVTYTSSSNCTVATGTWHGPFTGTTFTRASDVDIDHMVPLKNAHISGGWQWSSAKKRDYYNYLGYANHLIAVDDATNQSKSDRSPDQWKPPNPNYHCTYAKDWINIKNQWSLTVTSTEWSALQSMLNTCGQTFTYTPPTAPAPVAVAPAPPVQQPSVNITTTYPCESSDCNCSDFSTWQAAKDVLNRSLATYGTDKHRLDRDGDGSPCESLPGAP